MPEWLSIILALGGSALISSIIGYLFNYVVNRPKQKKLEKEKEKKERQEELLALKTELIEVINDIKAKTVEEREGCKKDHCSLVGLVKDIQSTNRAQNAGLQSVLKDLLKIRYLEWIKKGYAPLDARDDLEKMYQSYHALGANGVMDNMRKQFLDLPIKSITTTEEHTDK